MRTLESMPGDRPAYLGAKEETLRCEDCGNDWTRQSRRGRKPPRCPSCQEAKVKAKPISAPLDPQVAEDRMALARAAKAQRAEEAARRASEKEVERRLTIARQLPRISDMWDKAFTFALSENTDEAWKRCETLMTSYVGSKNSLSAE